MGPVAEAAAMAHFPGLVVLGGGVELDGDGAALVLGAMLVGAEAGALLVVPGRGLVAVVPAETPPETPAETPTEAPPETPAEPPAGALAAPDVLAAPDGAALPVSDARSGWTCVILHSIAGRFSSGVVGPPFSRPLQSTLEILPSPARNAWLPRAVNVNFERYSNTP